MLRWFVPIQHAAQSIQFPPVCPLKERIEAYWQEYKIIDSVQRHTELDHLLASESFSKRAPLSKP